MCFHNKINQCTKKPCFTFIWQGPLRTSPCHLFTFICMLGQFSWLEIYHINFFKFHLKYLNILYNYSCLRPSCPPSQRSPAPWWYFSAYCCLAYEKCLLERKKNEVPKPLVQLLHGEVLHVLLLEFHLPNGNYFQYLLLPVIWKVLMKRKEKMKYQNN